MGQKEEDMLRKNIYLMQEQIQNAYKRIVELERTIITQQEWLDRHESNLMILHKKTTALEMEADILQERSEK